MLVSEARGEKILVGEAKRALTAVGSEDPENVFQRQKSSRSKFPIFFPERQRGRPDMKLRSWEVGSGIR